MVHSALQLIIRHNKTCLPSLFLARDSSQSQGVELSVKKLNCLHCCPGITHADLYQKGHHLYCDYFASLTMIFCAPMPPGDCLKLYSLHAWLGCSLETSCLWKPRKIADNRSFTSSWPFSYFLPPSFTVGQLHWHEEGNASPPPHPLFLLRTHKL